MPQVPQPGDRSYRVLTLNIWGLWLVSRDREARVRHLVEFLRSSRDLDLVLLQEVWVDQDAQQLLEAARQGCLPHGVHFRSKIFGSGLITLSRYPILEFGFRQYSGAGEATAVHCGDYYAGKGVGWVRVAMPHGCVDVYNTHLHANYSHKVLSEELKLTHLSGNGPLDWSVHVPQDTFAPYRLCNVFELGQVVRLVSAASQRSSGIILGGDLNTKPHFLEMALLRCLLPELVDSWVVVHGLSDPGLTCRAPDCSYRSTRQVPERIDYVLTCGLTPVTAITTLKRTPDGFSYSDHNAVQVDLTAPTTPTAQTAANQQLPLPFVSTGRFPWHSPCLGGRQHSGEQQPQGEVQAEVVGVVAEVVGCAMLVIRKGIARCTHNARERLIHGVLCWVLALLLMLLPLVLTASTTTLTTPTIRSFGRALSSSVPLVSALQTLVLHPMLVTLTASLLAAVGVLLVLVGGVADASQARAMQHTLSQMLCLASAAEEYLTQQTETAQTH